MKDPSPPAGFGAWWEGTILFVRLPEVVQTTAHVLEPVLSTADARQLAAMVGERQGEPTTRIVVITGSGYAAATTEKFRGKLVSLLGERGLRPSVEVSTEKPVEPALVPEALEMDSDTKDLPLLHDEPAPAAPPMAPPSAPSPSPPSPESAPESAPERTPGRIQAPIPARRRPGARGESGSPEHKPRLA